MEHYLIVDLCVIAYIVGMIASVYCMDAWRHKPLWYYQKSANVEASWAEVAIFLASWLGVIFQIVAVAIRTHRVHQKQQQLMPTHEDIP